MIAMINLITLNNPGRMGGRIPLQGSMGPNMDIMFEDNQVIIPIPKAVLVMSRAQFIECLRRVSPLSPVNASSFAVTVAPSITAQAASAVASLAEACKHRAFLSPGNRSVARLVTNRGSCDRI